MPIKAPDISSTWKPIKFKEIKPLGPDTPIHLYVVSNKDFEELRKKYKHERGIAAFTVWYHNRNGTINRKKPAKIYTRVDTLAATIFHEYRHVIEGHFHK